jgi:hypothetical protein
MSERSAALAERFEKVLADFAQAVEACPDDKWNTVCEEPWTVAQVAQHVAGQFPLESEFIFPAAEGRALPEYTLADIDSKNNDRAATSKDATKAAVLSTLREGGARLASYIRALSDDQLDRVSALPVAGGAKVTTQQILEGPILIDHVGGSHLASIRAMA